VALSATAAFGNLRAFVFCDHALKLHYELIFRRGPGGRLQENQFYPTTRELLSEQNLAGILTAHAAGLERNQRGSNLASADLKGRGWGYLNV
jgi:hypothetical protein